MNMLNFVQTTTPEKAFNPERWAQIGFPRDCIANADTHGSKRHLAVETIPFVGAGAQAARNKVNRFWSGGYMRVYVVWLMLVCCSLSGCVAAYYR
ncbi:hypothetical protein [Serratia fonticola]|uniref:Uncharacterized protein n=1 Tax=Serratia fonticola TaxID=47917 RepID=A0ABY9PGW4_SERFO|nr:hypothetical protein [Serratia fonticola]WMT12656.1 hypothetical protein RFB13_15475 [Serratia fonticola]